MSSAKNGYVLEPGVRARFGKAPFNSQANGEGLRLECKFQLTGLSSYLGGAPVLDGNGVSIGNVAGNYISATRQIGAGTPGLPSPLVGIPQTFQFYRIRHMELTYISSAGTGDKASIALAWLADSNQGIPVSQAQTRELPNCVEFPVWAVEPVVWAPICDRNMNDPDAKVFDCLAATSTIGANVRDAYQGSLVGFNNIGGSSSEEFGTLFATAVIDLYQLNYLQTAGASPSKSKSDSDQKDMEVVFSELLQDYRKRKDISEQKELPTVRSRERRPLTLPADPDTDSFSVIGSADYEDGASKELKLPALAKPAARPSGR
jgi:hypothetical protein